MIKNALLFYAGVFVGLIIAGLLKAASDDARP